MNKKILFILCGLTVIALSVCFYYTPHWAVSNMKEAAENRDADTLSEYVDFPALKESLKANFNAMMATEVSNNMNDNPFGAFGAALAAAFINPMIDNLVTPESLAMMMKGEKPKLEKINRENENNRPDTDENTETVMKYDNFNSFIVTVKEKGSSEDPIKMIFKRHGIVSWKLTALRLPSPDKENKHARVPPDSSKTAIEIKHTGKSQKDSGQTKSEPAPPTPALLTPTLSNKRFQKSDFTNGITEDAIWFDVAWDTSRLKRKTRAVKGVLIFGDIFGDTKLRLRWTINEPLVPNVTFVEKGVGFGFNQFNSSHKWVRNTDLKDMKFSFEVDEIIYQDESPRTVNDVNTSSSLIKPVLTNKRFQNSDFSKGVYEDAIWFDINWDTSKLKRKTRAIKGILVLGDIFGEPKFRINMTINDPLIPGKNYTQQGIGFDYNQFTESHKWVRFTELKDMTFAFEVKDIIYADEVKNAEPVN